VSIGSAVGADARGPPVPLIYDPSVSILGPFPSPPSAFRCVPVGDYRVVYEVHDDRLIVLVLRVAHRKDVYRGG
jgi:plasmid stabilization system protein ParE